jgi:hypothetical protein
MHQPFIVRMTRPVANRKEWHTFHIAAVGSAGVTQAHLGDERYNTYGLIEFSRESYQITVRRIDRQLSIPREQAVLWQHALRFGHNHES